jgi:hypothetical protein
VSEQLLAGKLMLGTWGVEARALRTRRVGILPWRFTETVYAEKKRAKGI